MQKKKYLIIVSKALNEDESIEPACVASTLDNKVTILITGGGIEHILKQTKQEKNLWDALALYDISEVYIDEPTLKSRGLNIQDIAIPCKPLTHKRLAKMLHEHDLTWRL